MSMNYTLQNTKPDANPLSAGGSSGFPRPLAGISLRSTCTISPGVSTIPFAFLSANIILVFPK